MSEILPDDPACALLREAPMGDYLLELVDGWRLLWRLSEGEPPDGAFDAAEAWSPQLQLEAA
jgi:hypothetical protein